MCLICKLELESATHALWSCISTPDVWGASLKCLQKVKVVEIPFKELVMDLSLVLCASDLAIFAKAIYQLWKRRNSYAFQGKFIDPNSIVQYATQKVIDFQVVKQKPMGEGVTASQDLPQWIAPPSQVYKANWDASVD